MSRKKRKKPSFGLDTEWTGLCCECGLPVNDDDGVYICEGEFMHYDCMDKLPLAKDKAK